MHTKMAILVMALALAGCGKPQTPQAQAGDQANVRQLDAQAKAAEAEADRLLAQAGQPASAAAPAAAAPAAPTDAHALAEGDDKLNTGQYYDTIGFDMQAGQTFNIVYDAHGYQPAMIVLGPDNKPDSQSQGPTPNPNNGIAHLESETKADRSGTWHVLVSSIEPGATGAYTVRVDTETETPG